jgi:hypothetical protein
MLLSAQHPIDIVLLQCKDNNKNFILSKIIDLELAFSDDYKNEPGSL